MFSSSSTKDIFKKQSKGVFMNFCSKCNSKTRLSIGMCDKCLNQMQEKTIKERMFLAFKDSVQELGITLVVLVLILVLVLAWVALTR